MGEVSKLVGDDEPVFDFFDGGAEDEITLRENVGAFQRLRLAPRVLRDVSRVDLAGPLLGAPAALPCAIAPTGAVGFGWRGGDVALARAAAQAGIPYALSTSATASIEEIADRAPGRLWFQASLGAKQAAQLCNGTCADNDRLSATMGNVHDPHEDC